MTWLQRFLSGRYGNDQFSTALVILAVFLEILGNSISLSLLQVIGLALIIFALFRMLSKNFLARRRENDWFLRWSQPLYVKVGAWFNRMAAFCTRRLAEHRDREHRYFNCASCRARLRVPKNRGTLQVTCPKCGKVTKVKS